MSGNHYAAEQLEYHTRKAERKRKRIILEVPEQTKVAIFSYVYENNLAAKLIDTDDLKEGSIIVCNPEE